jgi:hypothetical protein
MPDRSTPLQRTILHTLRLDRAMTADEVFERLGVARPDVADSSITAAVRAAVARNLDVLAADGWIDRDGTGYVLAQRLLAELAA